MHVACMRKISGALLSNFVPRGTSITVARKRWRLPRNCQRVTETAVNPVKAGLQGWLLSIFDPTAMFRQRFDSGLLRVITGTGYHWYTLGGYWIECKFSTVMAQVVTLRYESL